MIALAPVLGVSLADLELLRRSLAVHEQDFNSSFGTARRAELAQLMALDIAELVAAYKRLVHIVEKMSSA